VNTADLAPAVPPSAFGGEISAIETVANPAAGMNAQVLFTGADNGRVFRSTDGGVMFDEVDTGALGHYVSDILAVPGDPSIVYQSRSAFTGATPPHTVRKSVDGGLTWSDASTGLPDVPANALALDPIVPNRIWLGTDVGMYVSTDAAQSWQPYNDGLPNVPVFDLASSNAGAVILACTYGRGAFVLHLDQIFGDGFGS